MMLFLYHVLHVWPCNGFPPPTFWRMERPWRTPDTFPHLLGKTVPAFPPNGCVLPAVCSPISNCVGNFRGSICPFPYDMTGVLLSSSQRAKLLYSTHWILPFLPPSRFSLPSGLVRPHFSFWLHLHALNSSTCREANYWYTVIKAWLLLFPVCNDSNLMYKILEAIWIILVNQTVWLTESHYRYYARITDLFIKEVETKYTKH